jgi:transposase
MRGSASRQATMLLGITAHDLIPPDHPIRAIKRLVDQALTTLSPRLNAMYAPIGRHSIPPEHLLKATLLMALYTIRSERQFCERLQYDLLFKWFLDLNIADAAFEHSSFTKNRQRLLKQQVAEQFFAEIVGEAKRRRLLSPDHFTVDGTLLDAWASLKSFKPKDPPTDGTPPPSGATGGKNPEVDFRGERRSNATHQSTTDPEARLARKGNGQTARLCFQGHVLMENRNGLIVDLRLTEVSGRGEWEAALEMLAAWPGKRRKTLGADKGYDTKEFVQGCRARNVTPHVARKAKYSAIDERTTTFPGYSISQQIRKRVEEIFGWAKTVGGGRKLRYVGILKNRLWFTLTGAVYNLVRMAKLELAPAA